MKGHTRHLKIGNVRSRIDFTKRRCCSFITVAPVNIGNFCRLLIIFANRFGCRFFFKDVNFEKSQQTS